MSLILRPDQEDVKRGVYDSIRAGKEKVVVQAMTSFGKTALAASIIHDAIKKDVGVIFTAPMITLVEQTASEFYKFGISDIGIIQADHPATNYAMPIQVCSIQSIENMMKRDMEGWRRFQGGRLIFHDECHIHHKTHKKMNELADKPVVGLSATPWRKGLGLEYDNLVLGPSTRWLIDNGHLSPYRAYSHYAPDMKGVRVDASGDYSKKQSGEKYDKRIIGNIVGTWKKYAEGEKTILFAPRVVDAERFAAEFRDQGIRAVAVSGYMDQDECADEVERFRRGEVTVICSVVKLATGFNVTDVGCIIDAQPTKSLMRHIQKLGRGLRTHPGKEYVVILDNAGNLLRNGLPDGDFPIELNHSLEESSDKRDPDDPLPKECIKCHFMKPPKTRECPNCGFTPEKQSEIEVEEGELVELDLKNAKKANRDMSWDEKVNFIGELKGYAIQKSYKPGWVSNQYREKTGVWPNDRRLKQAVAIEPSDLIMGWVKHQAIKRRARAS